jgi:O-antigen ligase
MAQDFNMFSSIHDSRTLAALEHCRAGLLVLCVVMVAAALGLTIALERWLVVAAALALLTLLVWPMEVALGLYAFLIPFEVMTATGIEPRPSITLLRYAGIVALIVVPGVGWLRERLVKPPRAALFWAIFVLWSALSTLWAIDQEAALRRLPTAVGLGLLYLAVVSVRVTVKELSRITLLAILGGCTAAMYSTYMFVETGSASGRASLIEGSFQADPNFFAATLLLPFALAFAEVFASRSWWRRTFFLAAVGEIALAILLSMSRGLMAATAVITFVFVVRLRLNWRLLFPVAIVGVALLYMPSMFYERVHEATDSRISGRLDIWEAGLHSLVRYGMFGAGLENFPNAYQKYAGTARFFSGENRASHNIYLTTSVEYGILGILSLFAAVRSHLREFARPAHTLLAPVRVIALEAACWGILVAGLSIDLLWRKGFWFVWALPVIAIHVLENSEQPVESDRLE